MKFMKVVLTYALLAVAIAKVHSLECYVCDENCDELTDNMLMNCGPEMTTSTLPPTPETTTVTTTTGSSSTTVSSETTSTTMGTTTTGGPSTTTPENATPTITTEPTTTTSTTVTTTTLATTEAITTTTTPATTTPGGTNAPTTVSDAPPATETTTTAGPTTEGVTTEAPLPSNASIRKRRAASPQQQAVNQLLLSYRSNSRTRRDTTDGSYACYAINKEDGDSTKRHYGCVMIPTDKSGCDAVRDKLDIEGNGDNSDCVVCFNDRCNSSATLRLSAIALIGLLFAKMLL